MLLSTNICFDAHVDELFLPLCFGGTITCLSRNIAQSELDPSWNLTFLQSTPSVLQVISVPDSVQCVLIGGEALNRACLEKVLRPGRVVLNGYGPTETTNESSMHVVRHSGDFRSIGGPLWNTKFFILDESGRNFVPKHAWGELFIGGLGVTKGYQNLAELTDKSFLSDHPVGTRVYRTGDIVRINREGELEFKGRKNSCGQIKLRGYRIELGEIQYALLKNNEGIVSEAHVSLINDQIIAHVTPEFVDTQALSYGLLPDYMKPSAVVALKSFPRTVSGKLDLKALTSVRVPGDGRGKTGPSLKIQGVLEGVIRAMQETLTEYTQSIGEDTNFFSIGGNSLNLIILHEKLVKRFTNVPRLQILLQLQTAGKISAAIENITGQSLSVPTDPILVPLSVGGSTPFFCVHAAGGQVHTYSLLASKMTEKIKDIAFIALQDPSLTLGAQHRLNSFEALGALYAKRINDFHPPGAPVFLGGHSSGGYVAFETAKSLEQDFGQTIGAVFLIDSEFPSARDPQENVIEKLEQVRFHLYHGWKEGLMHDYMRARKISASNVLSTELVDMVALLSHHLQIEKKYVPSNFFMHMPSFPLVLFRPTQDDEGYNESGWSDVTNGRVGLVEVPEANHYSIIREPAVDLVASEIAAAIYACTHPDTQQKY